MPKKLAHALSAVTVKSAKPGRHSDGGGLQLLVKKSGARSWVFRFMLRGLSRDIGLGPAAGPGALTLADARDRAIDLMRLVKAGIDPLEQRATEAADAARKVQSLAIARITFEKCAEAYLAAHGDKWRNSKHRAQWGSTLATYVFPVMGNLPVASIETKHVMAVLEPIWKTKPETASRVRGRIEAILDSAKARGYREGENPARWRGHIAQILPARTQLSRGHHRAMSYRDVPLFMAQLRAHKSVSAMALEFAILTAGRTGEVLGAMWKEFDLESAVWSIPAERMKHGKPHREPLCLRAMEILHALRPLNLTYVFAGPNGKPLSNMAMSMLARRIGMTDTVHGFRSSFRDWADDHTDAAHEVKEMAMAHTISNKAEAAYRRGDLFEKRRKLMGEWMMFCTSAEPQASNIHTLANDCTTSKRRSATL